MCVVLSGDRRPRYCSKHILLVRLIKDDTENNKDDT